MGGLAGGSDMKMPVTRADNPTKTAAPVEQITEQAKKNKALAASLITQNWGASKLAKKGLLGVGAKELI